MDLLLVEDDVRVKRFVRRGLEAEGHGVTVASDGREGLTRVLSEQYDVVILDVMLPVLDGREICNRLRSSKNATPVLMLTALDTVEDKVASLRGGADDYLVKPFDFDELLARIEALGRRANGFSAQASSTIECGDIRLDLDSRQVFQGGKAVSMTAKELLLLEMFLTAPGKVQSRTRILNKVWGYNSDPLTNVVDVYIRRLRSKFSWDCEAGPIKTVRNFGYRFDKDYW